MYILAHDLGTSGNKATLFSLEGKLIKSTVFAYPLITEQSNYAEQRAEDWWRAVCETTKELLNGIAPADVAAVSFSGQMSGCLCVDSAGEPLHNAIIWADMRADKQEKFLREQLGTYRFYQTTGQRISASYSAFKVMWLKENLPQVYERTHKIMNAKDYIIFKLTNRFVTEPSDASSTGFLDIRTFRWSDEIFEATGVDKAKFPEIHSSVDIAGKVTEAAAAQTGLLSGTPVVIGGGDCACAAVGTGVVKEGVANCSLGTSSWISIASKQPVMDERMIVFNFAHMVPGYVVPNGTMQTGGGALNWTVNTLFGGVDGYDSPSKSEIYATVGREVAASPVRANNLLFLPYLIGERSPRWNSRAKGSFVGLTLSHARGDMLRAVMESVGYNLDKVLKNFAENGHDIRELVLVGGGARNVIWRQILCNIFGTPVLVPDYLEEATSMGAAIAAGVGIGAFESFDVVDRFIRIQSEVKPDSRNEGKYAEMKALFDEAYTSLAGLFDRL